jgi:DNA-binding response OmpR family regulator
MTILHLSKAIEGGLRQETAPLGESQVLVLWLHSSDEPAAHRQIRLQFQTLGFCVEAVAFNAELIRSVRCYDLIVIGVTYQELEHASPILTYTRRHSRAPIVVLAEQPRIDWLVSMVNAGADAVIDNETPEPVILVRCMALLRRWGATQPNHM